MKYNRRKVDMNDLGNDLFRLNSAKEGSRPGGNNCPRGHPGGCCSVVAVESDFDAYGNYCEPIILMPVICKHFDKVIEIFNRTNSAGTLHDVE